MTALVPGLRGAAGDVAERTLACPVAIWGFGVGGMLSGLVRAGLVLGRPAYVERVADLVGPSLAAAPAATDHLIAGGAPQAVRAARPAVVVDDACARWPVAVRTAGRPVAGGPRLHRPGRPRGSAPVA